LFVKKTLNDSFEPGGKLQIFLFTLPKINQHINMKPIGFFLFILILGTTKIDAQMDCRVRLFDRFSNPDSDIYIVQDEQISELMNKFNRINCQSKKIPGYRIRIFSDLTSDSRERAIEAKADFYRAFGVHLPVYVVYTDPYYKVYVGDFKSRHQVFLHLNEIKKEFPGAFPRRTMIQYPKLNSENRHERSN